MKIGDQIVELRKFGVGRITGIEAGGEMTIIFDDYYDMEFRCMEGQLIMADFNNGYKIRPYSGNNFRYINIYEKPCGAVEFTLYRTEAEAKQAKVPGEPLAWAKLVAL